MNRREVIALIGSAAAWPLVAQAQQRQGAPVIGLVRGGLPGQLLHLQAAFHKGLSETGHVENQNVAVDYRWAEGNYERLPELLNDLVRRQVSVIAVPGSTIAAIAAKVATQTIPVVFMIGTDPVEFGLVRSLARPGGNLTGIAQLAVPVVAKRLDVLHQLAPQSRLITVLINPTNPSGEAEAREVRAAAGSRKLQLNILEATNPDEIDSAFAKIAQETSAVILTSDALFTLHSGQIAINAARHRIPVIAHYREFPVAGGLMSYGNNVSEAFRLTGVYVGRILKGEKPADLPIMQPTKFEFIINLRTAKALDLTIPPTLLALADEVIE